MLRWAIILGITTCVTGAPSSRADDLLYQYEADVVPYDPSAGWVLADSCSANCRESIEDGHLLLHWDTAGGDAVYRYDIARPGTPPPPPTLWVEWRFRSNHPLGCCFYSCDAGFLVKYKGVDEYLFLYGDAVISFDVASFITDLEIDVFHTCRFESLDGVHYSVAVDGQIFLVDQQNEPNGYNAIAIFAQGGCIGDQIPDALNAWDFVRFGTISYGEQIVETDPPTGFIDAREHPALDRFTVRNDTANYVYIDEITVDVTPNQYRDRQGAVLADYNTEHPNPERQRRADRPALALGVPIVVATRRLDNGPSDVVEIVLDRPIPYNATTRFTFNDGTLSQSLEFTYAPGDTDGDGRATLSDLADFQNCFSSELLTGVCPVFDFNHDDAIDLADLAQFILLAGVP
jgi:hypothetical protein